MHAKNILYLCTIIQIFKSFDKLLLSTLLQVEADPGEPAKCQEGEIMSQIFSFF